MAVLSPIVNLSSSSNLNRSRNHRQSTLKPRQQQAAVCRPAAGHIPRPTSHIHFTQAAAHSPRFATSCISMEEEPAATGKMWGETAMLVIDMQKDFVLPGGPAHVAGAAGILPAVAKAVSFARARGALVVWVVREHDPYGRDVELFRRRWYVDGGGPTAKGSEGAELVDGLVMEGRDYKVVKTRFSAFFDTNLHSLLQSNGIKSIVVVGVQTPNCIRQTVFDAVALNYQAVSVIVDATAAATPEIHNANILDMKNVGVMTIPLQEWCDINA